MKHFRYALESYGKGFSVSPEKYYCGINYATLLEKEKSHSADSAKQLAAITQRFERTIPRICVALGKVDAIHPRSWGDYWDLATAIELAALSQQWEMGISAMRALNNFTDHPEAKGCLQSTFSQLRSVIKTLKDHGLTPTPNTTLFEWWMEFYCQVFNDALATDWQIGEFKVVEIESSSPMTIILDKHDSTMSIQRNIQTSERMVIPSQRVHGAQNLNQNEQGLTVAFTDEAPVTIQFPHRENRIQFANAVGSLKNVAQFMLIDKKYENSSDIAIPEVGFSYEEVGNRAKKKRILGKGNFGCVYQAMNTKTGAQIAIKEVSSKLIVNMGPGTDGGYKLDEIVKEVNNMIKFQHQNIVQYLGCQKGPKPTEFYIFMENMPGGSLEDLLKKTGAPLRDTVRSYTRQLVTALQYLHGNGILHRDIKSGNILLDQSLKVVKLADFGTSIVDMADFNKEAKVGGKHGAIFGFTAPFCPPEVINGKWSIREGDPSYLTVDIWALGCVVLQMISATKETFYDSAWDIDTEDQPIHQEDPDHVQIEFHEQIGKPCWV
jgi:hypothetical protein